MEVFKIIGTSNTEEKKKWVWHVQSSQSFLNFAYEVKKHSTNLIFLYPPVTKEKDYPCGKGMHKRQNFPFASGDGALSAGGVWFSSMSLPVDLKH